MNEPDARRPPIPYFRTWSISKILFSSKTEAVPVLQIGDDFCVGILLASTALEMTPDVCLESCLRTASLSVYISVGLAC